MKCPRCNQLEDTIEWYGNALSEIHKLVRELERHSKVKIKKLEAGNGNSSSSGEKL